MKLGGLLGFLLGREKGKGSLLGFFFLFIFFFSDNFNVVKWKENERRMAAVSLNRVLAAGAYLTRVNYPLISVHRTGE